MTQITSHTAEIRKWEAGALADGQIDAKDIQDLAKITGKKGKDASKDDKALLKDIFVHDRFDPAVTKDFFTTTGVDKKTKASPVLGTEVAKDVFAKQDLGPANGFTTKLQAIAAARMANTQNVAVVPDKDGRWHAVETNKPMNVPFGMNKAEWVVKIDDAAYAALAKTARTSTDLDTRNGALQQMAAAAYGVSLDDVKVLKAGEAPVAGKINVNPTKDLTGAGRITAACSCAAHTNFKADAPTAIEIAPSALETPQKAASTMFHEQTHADDYAKAQDLYDAYAKKHPKEAKALNDLDFTKTPTDPKEIKARAETISAFQTWALDKKNLGKNSVAEQQKLVGYMTGRTGGSEATAYTKTWMQAFENAKPGTRTLDLAGELLTWGRWPEERPHPAVERGEHRLEGRARRLL